MSGDGSAPPEEKNRPADGLAADDGTPPILSPEPAGEEDAPTTPETSADHSDEHEWTFEEIDPAELPGEGDFVEIPQPLLHEHEPAPSFADESPAGTPPTPTDAESRGNSYHLARWIIRLVCVAIIGLVYWILMAGAR